MTLFVAIISAAAGGALVWFSKDKIVIAITGAGTFARDLEAKAAALRAKL